MNRRILIVGCGDIGIDLGQRLVEAGHEVWGLRRRADRVPPPVVFVQGDVCDPSTLKSLPDRVDIIVIILTAGSFDINAYRRTYVNGVENLLRLFPERGHSLTRILFVSSTSVYGQSHGEWVDEFSETAARHFSGRIMLEAERRVLAASFPSTAVRFAGIYGPGRVRTLDRLMKGEYTCRTRPPVYRNLIHRDDVVGVLYHLIACDRTESIYIGVDHEPVNHYEYLCWLADHFSLPRPRVDNSSREAGGRNDTCKRCRNDRLVATGYRFIYPTFREGYQRIMTASGDTQATA